MTLQWCHGLGLVAIPRLLVVAAVECIWGGHARYRHLIRVANRQRYPALRFSSSASHSASVDIYTLKIIVLHLG